jgi:O-antigen biosynthesis protein
MSQTGIQKTVFIITGMHRSGTSLVASLFQNAGVDIGGNLLESDFGNTKGYFEDVDFIDFHQKVLHSKGIYRNGWTCQGKMEVQEQFVVQAKDLLQQRSFKQLWGWKDPRTTLFLDFWQNLLPEAFFVFVYRAPWEVIDSLYRRGDDTFFENPNLALKAWETYNLAILTFHKQFALKSILVSLDDVVADQDSLLRAINKKFGILLSYSNKNIYDKKKLHEIPHSSHRPGLIKHYFPEVIDLYFNLQSCSEEISEVSIAKRDLLSQVSSFDQWALQDWQQVKLLEKKICEIKNENQNLWAELQIQRNVVSELTGSTFFKLRNLWIKLKKGIK